MDFIEKQKKMRRGPAIMLPKDIGFILANTNIDKDSIVLDAGSGTGLLTCYLARFVKKVYSYDNKEKHLDIAKENAISEFNLRNIEFVNADVYEEIKQKDLDLVTLDLSEPWQALNNVHKALKKEGYLTCYLPNITQVQKLVLAAQDKFKILKVSELIERPWVVEEQRLRPEHMILGHTGWIIIARKI